MERRRRKRNADESHKMKAAFGISYLSFLVGAWWPFCPVYRSCFLSLQGSLWASRCSRAARGKDCLAVGLVQVEALGPIYCWVL